MNMAKSLFEDWKKKKNPIAPDYQVPIIAFGMTRDDYYTFIDTKIQDEAKKTKGWNPYLRRLIQAALWYEHEERSTNFTPSPPFGTQG